MNDYNNIPQYQIFGLCQLMEITFKHWGDDRAEKHHIYYQVLSSLYFDLVAMFINQEEQKKAYDLEILKYHEMALKYMFDNTPDENFKIIPSILNIKNEWEGLLASAQSIKQIDIPEWLKED